MSGALDLALRSLSPARLRRASLIRCPPGRLRQAFRGHWPAADSALIPAQAPGAKAHWLVSARQRARSRETSHLCLCRGFTRPPAPRLATTPTTRPRRSLSSPGGPSCPIVGARPPWRKGAGSAGPAGPRPARSSGEGSPPSPASDHDWPRNPARRPGWGHDGPHAGRALRPPRRSSSPAPGSPAATATALSGRERRTSAVWRAPVCPG
jgi:hypothetical protein